MIIGVDIGGTKTLVASFHQHEIVREDRFATSGTIDEFLSDLIPLLRAHAEHHRVEAISIAAPGIVDRHRGSIVRCGNLDWHDVPLRQLLRDQGFSCPILLENDANLAGLAEANALEPIPQLCLYLTVSTGIGSGIIVNGRINTALGNSEAGHIVLKRGEHYVEWEDLASGRSMLERTGKLASQQRDQAVWHDVASRVADGLLVLIPTLQPTVIVIGGGIGVYLDTRWRWPLEELLKKRMSPFITDIPPILQSQYPKESVLYGCKHYAEQHLERS